MSGGCSSLHLTMIRSPIDIAHLQSSKRQPETIPHPLSLHHKAQKLLAFYVRFQSPKCCGYLSGQTVKADDRQQHLVEIAAVALSWKKMRFCDLYGCGSPEDQSIGLNRTNLQSDPDGHCGFHVSPRSGAISASPDQ